MARIVVTNHNIDNNRIVVNFDTIKEDSFNLEMELKDSPVASKAIWGVFSNGEQLDSGDLTKGNKAELIVLKSYAGSHEKPHLFTVSAKDENGNPLASIQLIVVAKPRITEAKWWNSQEDRQAYEVGINNNSTVFIKGIGLYGHPLKIDVYFKRQDGESKILFTSIFTINELYSLQGFYLSHEEFLKNKSFYASLLPILITSIVVPDTLAVTGKIKHRFLGKLYFIISYDNLLLFDGDKKKKYLDVFFDFNQQEKPVTTLSPVTIFDEKYFTQKYEPCKYEKVFYKYGAAAEVKLFDEKEPTRKDQHGQFGNMKFMVSAIAPPKDSKNIKELSIRLENTNTKECQYIEGNIKQTFFSENDERERKKPHKGRVIDTQILEDSQIKVQVVKEDEDVHIYPSFNYQFDEKSSWSFLKNYFLFSSMMSSTDPAYSTLKGVLMDWEISNKNLIQYYRIPIQSCRYQKSLYLKTFADVAWGFHAFYKQPANPKYYLNDKDIVKREGLDEHITWVQKHNQYFNVLMPLDPFGFADSINDFILELLKDMAKDYGLAFTAYYDFNEKGKCDKRIEYAKEYPNIFDGIIAGAVTLEILIQVILLIITEGASAELLLARMSKAGVKMSGELANMARKAERNIDNIRKKKLLGTAAKVGHTIITTPSVSYYKGYRFAEGENIGVQPLLEERIAFSPLFGIDHEHKKNLGDLVYEKTPVYKVIDLSQKALGFLTIGFNRHLLRPINKDAHEAVGLSDHYLNLVGDAFGKVNEYLAFVTKEMIEKIFGATAEFAVEVKGGYGMDFELKIHNAEKKLNLTNFSGKGSVNDASVATVGSNKELKVEVKIDANVKVPVKAMNIINYIGKTTIKDIEAGAKFEINSGVFLERRYYFHASEKKPYYQDSVIFTGVAGEYSYNMKVESKDKDKKMPQVEQKPKTFVLLPPQTITHNPVPIFENPAK